MLGVRIIAESEEDGVEQRFLETMAALIQSNDARTIDHFRWDKIAYNSLLYATALLFYSHSIVPGGFDVTS
jgi:endo-1,4-beta-D-glucanase Y